MGGVLVDEPEGLCVILADDVSVQDFSGNAPRGCLRQHCFLPRQLHGSLLGRDGGNGRDKGLRGRGGFHRLFRHGNHRLGGHGGGGLSQGAGRRCLDSTPRRPDGRNAVSYLGGRAPFRVPGGLDRRSRCHRLRTESGLGRLGWLGRGGGFYNGRCSGGFRPLFPVRLGVHGLKKVLPGILGLSDRRGSRLRHSPTASIQRVHDRVEHSIKYVMLLGKFHLGLGGMDVHVHRRHRQQHLQHTAGEPALEKLIPVAFL